MFAPFLGLDPFLGPPNAFDFVGWVDSGRERQMLGLAPAGHLPSPKIQTPAPRSHSGMITFTSVGSSSQKPGEAQPINGTSRNTPPTMSAVPVPDIFLLIATAPSRF